MMYLCGRCGCMLTSTGRNRKGAGLGLGARNNHHRASGHASSSGDRSFGGASGAVGGNRDRDSLLV